MTNIVFYKKNIVLFLFILMVILLFSFIVGMRDHDIGTDTAQYARIFNLILEAGYSGHEIGFVFFVKAFGSILSESEWLFFLICFFITIVYLLSSRVFISTSSGSFWFNSRQLVVCLSLMLLSSWYLVAVTNGLRQGLALSFLYLSISLFLIERVKSSVIVFLLGVSFHLSILLVLPFVVFLFVRTIYLIFLLLLFACFYYFGVFEKLVEISSRFLGISVYKDIKEFGAASDNWVGFDLSFVLYTLFWPSLFYLFSVLGLYRKDLVPVVMLVIKAYSVLAMPYLVFGFGPYSNRYAFIAWFFIPLMQSFCLTAIKLDRKFFDILLFLLAGFASFRFLLYFSFYPWT